MKEIKFRYFLNGQEVDGDFINWEYTTSIMSKDNEIYATYNPEDIDYVYGKSVEEDKDGGVFINDMLGSILLNSPNELLGSGCRHIDIIHNPQVEILKELAEKLVITDSGKLSMGVLNPNAKLEVKSLSNLGIADSGAIQASAYKEDNYVSPLPKGLKQDGFQNPTEGVKHNKYKAPLDIVQTRQFTKALQALALATAFGNKKYEATDKDFLNFKRVAGGSQTYFDAAARHNAERNEVDEDSGLPHVIHAVWDMMAALEIYIEESGIDIKEFSKLYLENLHSK